MLDFDGATSNSSRGFHLGQAVNSGDRAPAWIVSSFPLIPISKMLGKLQAAWL